MTKRLREALLPLVLGLAVCGPAAAEDFTLDDVSMGSATATYRAKRIEISGANISREEARRLLAADSAEPGADRLARIDAARIVLPELVSETRSGDYTQTISYRDVVIVQMAKGVAQTVDCAGATIQSKRGDASSRGTFGASHMEGVDFALLLRIAGGVRGAPDEPKRQTAASFSMDGMTMDIAEGGRMTAGRMTGRAFAGRPLAAPMSSLVELAPKPAEQPSEAARAALSAMTADFFTSVDFGALELNDIVVARDADARGPATRVDIRRVAFEGMKDGRIDRIALEGIDTGGAPNLKILRLVVDGFDPRPSFIAAASPTKRAVPQFDRLEVQGLSIDAHDGPIGLGKLTVDAKDWKDLAPAALTARAENLAVSLAGPAALRAPALAALGYTSLDLSAGLDARYDAQKQELALNEISMREPSVGKAQLAGFLGHVSPDLMSGDDAATKSAIAALVFWRADLALENGGALDRFIAAQAKQTGKPAATLRDNLAGAAKALVLNLFATGGKPDPQVSKVGDALANFVKGAKAFELHLSAPDGLGMIDLAMAGKLGGLVDRLKIDATAK
ncbi:MAG: hypothetical protein U1E28_22460 [Beijerinckiaceae bacterium]